MENGIVYLDPTADSGVVATMTEETAEALGWSLNGSSIGGSDNFCYAIIGMPWNDDETAEMNDAQRDHDWRETVREIEAAGLGWVEV